MPRVAVSAGQHNAVQVEKYYCAIDQFHYADPPSIFIKSIAIRRLLASQTSHELRSQLLHYAPERHAAVLVHGRRGVAQCCASKVRRDHGSA